MEQTNKGLSGNQLKLFAMLAMTVDHFTSVIWPDYPRDWWILLLHIIGRMAAPIFWFMVAEGYHYTRNLKKYAGRLLLFAVIGHFAYNFAFGIPFVPLKTGVFNQTSVMWPLFLGVVGLYTVERPELKQWQKTLAVVALTLLAFPGDWSSIAVLAILEIGQNRGDFRRQMTRMMLWVAMYALVYALFIDPVYGILQLFAGLTIPLLKRYNGTRGAGRGMKYLFYLYYPAHLFLCGLVRILLYGNVGVLAERGLERVEIGSAVLCGNDGQLGVRGKAVGLHDLDDLRVHAGGNIRLCTLAVAAHGDGLGGSGRAVVVGGVGNVHARQLADHSLELERALQHALTDLRLIGRVAGDQLLAGGDGLHNGGNEVAVGARAAQNGLVDLVLLRHGGDGLAYLQLAHALGDVERPVQQHPLRDRLIQVLKAFDPDGSKHFLPFRRGGRNIRAHQPSSAQCAS